MKITVLLLTSMAVLTLSSRGICEEKATNPAAKFAFVSMANEDSTFMKLRVTLLSTKNARQIQNAKFGIAEYYFKNNDYTDAIRDFQEFARGYPPGAPTLLAKAYLYKIARFSNDDETAKLLKKELFDNSFVLLFSKFKVLKYKSAFNNQYEIQYFLDKIKIFLNGEIFEEIIP